MRARGSSGQRRRWIELAEMTVVKRWRPGTTKGHTQGYYISRCEVQKLSQRQPGVCTRKGKAVVLVSLACMGQHEQQRHGRLCSMRETRSCSRCTIRR